MTVGTTTVITGNRVRRSMSSSESRRHDVTEQMWYAAGDCFKSLHFKCSNGLFLHRNFQDRSPESWTTLLRIIPCLYPTKDVAIANISRSACIHIAVLPVEYARAECRSISILMSNYLDTKMYSRCHAKQHRSVDWSAANSSALSCVNAKNSALMSSTCMQ